jgi:hypothetical protein
MRQRLGLILVCLGLACSSMACAPALVGPTAAGYSFSLEAGVPRIWLGVFDASSAERFPPLTEVIVRVQDASGQPVDGVPVTFEVDPAWAQHARRGTHYGSRGQYDSTDQDYCLLTTKPAITRLKQAEGRETEDRRLGRQRLSGCSIHSGRRLPGRVL